MSLDFTYIGCAKCGEFLADTEDHRTGRRGIPEICPKCGAKLR